MTRASILAPLALLAALLTACGSGVRAGSAGLSHEERRVVDTYLAALQRGDAAAVAALALPEVDGTADARRRVAALGGRSITGVSLVAAREFGPDFTRVEVSGRYGDGSAYAETVTLTRVDRRWYLVLDNAATPSRSPAGTSPG